MHNRSTGVLGASSLVGTCILKALAKTGSNVVAFSRVAHAHTDSRLVWEQLHNKTHTTSSNHSSGSLIENWICAAPIWVLSEYLSMLELRGAKRIVAISSTSVLTKEKSSAPDELETVTKLAKAEQELQLWCKAKGIEWIILRPTLIYGYGMDKNITVIVRFIRRFKFFPVFGKAQGMRQPLHADDLAELCTRAMQAYESKNKLYTVTGGEILSYKDMILRIFACLKQRPILVSVPLWLFSIAVKLAPRYHRWTVSMAERMNQDHQFDCSAAMHDFNFQPRPFVLTAEDLVVAR